MPNSNDKTRSDAATAASHPALFKTKHGYHIDAGDRLAVVKKSDWIGGLKEALDHDLQKTVRTAIERRLKKLETRNAQLQQASTPEPEPLTPYQSLVEIVTSGDGGKALAAIKKASPKLLAQLTEEYDLEAMSETFEADSDGSRILDEVNKRLGTPSSSSAPAKPDELIEPGQLSKTLASSLKEKSKSFADAQVATAFEELEAARSSYQVRAILLGIMLLAKKHATKHGEWKAWLTKFYEKHYSKSKRASILTGDSFQRTANVYMQLGKRFLWKVESNGFLDEVLDTDNSSLAVSSSQVLDLAQSPDKKAPIFGEMQRFVAGRSLRRMLADFRQAEKDADQDKDDAEGDTPTHPSDPSHPTDPTDPPPPQKPVQLLLWEAFQRDKAPMLDSIFDEPGTEDLRGDGAITYYTNIADELESRAKRARQLAEAAKEGNQK